MDPSTVTSLPASSKGIGANLRRGGPRIRRCDGTLPIHAAAYQLYYPYDLPACLPACLAASLLSPIRLLEELV